MVYQQIQQYIEPWLSLMIMVAAMHNDAALLMLAKTHMCSGRDAKAIAYWALCAPGRTQRNQTIIRAMKGVEAIGCFYEDGFSSQTNPTSFVRRMTRIKPRPTRAPGKEWPYGHRTPQCIIYAASVEVNEMSPCILESVHYCLF